MQEPASKETLTEVAIQRLTADIVDGILVPRQKLLMADLKKRYGMGASPLREALAQLVSLGFVAFDPRRGFRVAPISKEDLEDITQVRQTLETAALRRAMALGGDEWEVGIVAAFARMQRVVARCMEGEIDADVEASHKQFHTALIAGCQSPRLLELHSNFHDQASRYRHVMLEHVPSLDDFLVPHEQLMKVVLARRADEACAMLSDHMAITLRKVYPERQPAPAARDKRRAAAKKSARSTVAA